MYSGGLQPDGYFVNRENLTEFYLIINQNDSEEIKSIIDNCDIDIEFINGEQFVYINGINTKEYVSLPSISEKSSYFSQNPLIREKVCKMQHKFAEKYDLVIEGRDIGTAVFPNAEYKFFLTASVDSRAQRRYDTLKKKNNSITLEEVKTDLIQRDYNDTNRKISPLKQASDAILIDTSNDTINESVQKLLAHIK